MKKPIKYMAFGASALALFATTYFAIFAVMGVPIKKDVRPLFFLIGDPGHYVGESHNKQYLLKGQMKMIRNPSPFEAKRVENLRFWEPLASKS